MTELSPAFLAAVAASEQMAKWRGRHLGVMRTEDVTLVSLPTQVWAVKGHRHSEGRGDDIATIARDEGDARNRLVEVICQPHHDCQCETCERARRVHALPADLVEVVRIR